MPQVSGKVVEKYTQTPVRGVTVKILHYTALTDANGRFSLESPLGPVQINFTHRNFLPGVMALNVLRAGDIGVILLDSKVRAL